MRKKKQRKEEAEKWKCQGSECTSHWKSESGWLQCDYCDEFLLCPKCSRKYQDAKAAHEQICGESQMDIESDAESVE